jgi:hypothetical protein
MATLATIVAAIKALWAAGWLQPIGSFLIGWLLPSPAQKIANAQSSTANAEKKADQTGDTTDLNNIP